MTPEDVVAAPGRQERPAAAGHLHDRERRAHGLELGDGPGAGSRGHVDWKDYLRTPSGTVIAGKTGDGLTTYDARTGALGERLIRSLPPPPEDVYTEPGELFSPDGRYLAAPAGSDAIQVWDLERHRTLELEGHSGRTTALTWGRNTTRDTLISAGATDSTVRLWRP